MQFQLLFIIFVAIFIISAVLVFLGITKVIKIDNKYLVPLFSALVIEVVAAIIYLFYLGSNDPKVALEEAYIMANIDTTLNQNEKQQQLQRFIENAATLRELNNECRNQIAAMNGENEMLKSELAVRDSILSSYDMGQTVFFRNINALEKIFNTHRVRWFWLASPHTRNNVSDIYPVVNALINEIGVYNEPDADFDTITESWRKFIKEFRLAQEHNISSDPDGHIQRSDIIFLLTKKYQTNL
jgi:hypothetical protein